MSKHASFLVPLAYLAIVLWIETPARLGRLLFDDYDLTAMSLRGLNATLGRRAGRLDPPPYLSAAEFRAALDADVTLRSTYFLEYPHLALLLFRLGFVGRAEGLLVPVAVCDGCHNNVVEHKPRTPVERLLWSQLRHATRLYAVLMIACSLGLMVVIREGYQPAGQLSGSLWLLVLPGSLYFTLNRFDILPALLMAGSLACLGRSRFVASAVLLGLATMVKVYPLLLAPLILRYLAFDRRTLAAWGSVYAGTLLVLFLPWLASSGWSATVAPYRFQLTRPPEAWTFYGYLLPAALGEQTLAGGAFRLGAVLLTTLAAGWSRPNDLSALLRRGAMILLVFVAFQVFYSPQWIVWLSPFLVPLARLHAPVRWLTVALDLITYLSFPVVFDLEDAPARDVLVPALIYGRGAVLTALLAALVHAEGTGSATPRAPDLTETRQ